MMSLFREEIWYEETIQLGFATNFSLVLKNNMRLVVDETLEDKFPLKSTLCMLIALNNKVLNWEILRKMNRDRLGI